MFKKLMFFSTLAMATSAFADSAPIKVTSGYEIQSSGRFHSRWLIVKVTSLDNNLKIEKVTVDRGNCRDAPGASYNRLNRNNVSYPLKYGRTATYEYYDNCGGIEVKVDTNLGSWTVQ